MAEVRFDLANQPPQNSWHGGRQYRANVDTILAEDIGDSLCLNGISDLNNLPLASLYEKCILIFVNKKHLAYLSTSPVTFDHGRLREIMDTCKLMASADQSLMGFCTWACYAYCLPIVVDTSRPDHGANGISIAYSVAQLFNIQGGNCFTPSIAVGVSIKRFT